MDKKALMVKTLVELILFGIIALLIALPLIMKMFGFFVIEPETGTKKSLDALTIEINNLAREQTVPVYVDEDHYIQGYTINEPKPLEESCKKEEACLCICSIKEKCSQQDDRMKCSSLEFDIKINPDQRIDEKLGSEGNSKVQNCILKRQQDLVTISCS